MSYESDLREVMKRAQEQGWRIDKRKEYWFLFPPDQSKAPVRIAGTGHTKGRGWRNFLAAMKRNGYRS